MLTTKNTGLVQGVPLEDDPTTVRVKALRGFYDQAGQVRSPGDELTVKRVFAHYLIQTNKAVLLPSVEVVSVETAPTPPLPPEQLDTPVPIPDPKDPEGERPFAARTLEPEEKQARRRRT